MKKPLDKDIDAIKFVITGRYLSLARLATAAFFGGMAEAFFLVTITRTAFAITDNSADVGIIANRFLSVNQTLLVAVALLAVRMLLSILSSLQSAHLTSNVVAAVRSRLAKAFLDASWEMQQSQRSGGLQELLTNYGYQTSSMMSALNVGVLAIANLVALIGLGVAIDPLGSIVLVLSVIVLGSFMRPLRRLVRNRSKAATEAGMEFATSVSETSQLGLELHVFHVQEEALRRTEDLIKRHRETSLRLNFAAGLASPLYAGLSYVAVVGALALVALTAATSLTSLGAIMLVLLRSLSYGQALQSSQSSIASSTPIIEALQEQLATLEEARRLDGGKSIDRVGHIRADHVSFAYVEGQNVINDLSFDVIPGEIIGIVGPSGGGKSTLVQLLLGLRDPNSGSITVDGVAIGQFSKHEWARKVTFVPQDSHLVSGSIADNIAFLRSGVSRDDIEHAARLAHLHEDVMRFPEAYERSVGESGGHLSGGQRQRLCIARALVEQPDLLILDEPTSALDVRSEQLIRATLLGLKKDSTILVIAHRLSTLDICDRIMVIQDGTLRGFDSPKALEAENDFYREALVLSGMR